MWSGLLRPPGLSVIFLSGVSGQAAGKIPARCSPRGQGPSAAETLWDARGHRTPGLFRGTALIEDFLERAVGLLCLRLIHSAGLLKYLR